MKNYNWKFKTTAPFVEHLGMGAEEFRTKYQKYFSGDLCVIDGINIEAAMHEGLDVEDLKEEVERKHQCDASFLEDIEVVYLTWSANGDGCCPNCGSGESEFFDHPDIHVCDKCNEQYQKSEIWN